MEAILGPQSSMHDNYYGVLIFKYEISLNVCIYVD